MSLTALLFSAVGETEPYRQAGIHKVQVAEFYQCWCFSATGGSGRWAVLDGRGPEHAISRKDSGR